MTSNSDFVIHDSAHNGIEIGGGVYNVNLDNGILHTSGGTAGAYLSIKFLQLFKNDEKKHKTGNCKTCFCDLHKFR